MPMLTAVCLALIASFAAALAARVELRVSPKPVLFTFAFGVVGLFLALVLVPASAYFYIFHGDWFVLYFWDTATVPSALALLGFVGQWFLGALAFQLGGVLVRNQREAILLVLLSASVLLAVVPLVMFLDRLQRVGSYMQFSRNFGLTGFGEGALAQGTLAMGLLVLIGLITMLVRVRVRTVGRP